jgi:MFS transporter, PAT family, beta-lactamase induction signal transducer AmpG
MPTPARKHAPPWLYGLATLPFGVAAGFAQYAMPRFLDNIGVSHDDQSRYAALCLQPAAFQFLWAPIVDLGPRRKHWLILFSVLGALCFGAALMVDLRRELSWFVWLVVAGETLTGMTSSCLGGLMATTVPNELRGSASGWANAGNLGGAALGAGVTMWLAAHSRPSVVALITMLMVALPSLSVLFIAEPARVARPFRVIFGGMFRSVGRTLRSRPGFIGVLICISPVGTAAMLNLFSGMGNDYRVPEPQVILITGFLGGLITGVFSLIGGYLCDRMPRRAAYLASGALTALFAFGMSLLPLTPRSYLIGVTAYLCVAGLCYASFSAMVLEIVGDAEESASTQYTLFTAASNQAIAYTTRLDGLGARRWGVIGMLRTDALANVAGIVFLAFVMLFATRRKPKVAAS